jgi:norsolorinic acid ketoreductase
LQTIKISSNKNILITGANRGIGYGLLEAFVLRPNHTLIAAVRNPSAAKSQALLAILTGTGSQVLLVKIDSSSQTDAATAVKQLQSEHNITHLDLVIANSGICDHYGTIATLSVDTLNEHILVNATEPLVLFQTVLPLLKKRKPQSSSLWEVR